MAGNYTIQDVVHSLEQGPLAKIISLALIFVATFGVAMLALFVDFRGLSTAEGMDQAQIAREIARGNGFSTKFIRPAAVAQFENFAGEIPKTNFPETYHAPAHPFLNAIALSLFRQTWAIPPEPRKQPVFAQDRVIAAVAMLCFFGAVAISFYTIWLLFDFRVAALSGGLVLLCNILWEFTLSGLPQMLMLFLLAAAIHLMVVAIRAQEDGGRIDIPLALAGVVLGMLFLTHHGMALVFVGAMIFSMIWFRPRGLAALWMAGFFLACAIPWIVRNMMVTGNPIGLSLYALLDGVGSSAEFHMRSFAGLSTEVGDLWSAIRGRMKIGFTTQLGQIVQFLGLSLAAPVFFFGLLHPFKNATTSVAKWLVLAMWAGASIAAGMLGSPSATVNADNFQVLFIPIMTAYGLAFLLVLWNRLGVPYKAARITFLVGIFVLSGLPFLTTLLPTGGVRVQWPPYYPSLINRLGGEDGFMKKDELISSDIPWAVAWYADRDCLWLPQTVRSFYETNDFLKLGRPIKALLLSPLTANASFADQLVRGEFSEWVSLITRTGAPPNFSLTAPLPIPIADRRFPDYLIMADYPRWDPKAAERYLMEKDEDKDSQTDPSLSPDGN